MYKPIAKRHEPHLSEKNIRKSRKRIHLTAFRVSQKQPDK